MVVIESETRVAVAAFYINACYTATTSLVKFIMIICCSRQYHKFTLHFYEEVC